MSKYGNIKTELDGYIFASKREAERYTELKLLVAAGEITCLALQPKLVLSVNGFKVGTYIADFCYREDGNIVFEDVKGIRTALYRLKKKMVKAQYGIEIKEVE